MKHNQSTLPMNLLWLCVSAFAALACQAVQAQGAYPNKPITLLLPITAGSAGDVALRVVAQKMTENMKQSIVIENQPGVAGLLGTERIARAAPDGYLIGGLGDSVIHFAANLAPKLNFDPINDLAPIALVAIIPWTLVVNPAFGPKSLNEFVLKAKAAPGVVDYGSTGNGSASHVGMEMLAAKAAIKLNHIPYKGATPAVIDVVGGQVPAVFSAVSVVLPYVKTGKLIALGVPSPQRSPLMPDVPTFAEAGFSDFNFVTWVALFAPRGTPKPIIDRLNAETVKAVSDSGVRERLLALGLEPRVSTPEELGQINRSGHARVAAIIRDAKIKGE